VATRTSHPGRTLIIFLLVIVGMFAWCAAIGQWKPKLGLDLQGGQRITLKASTTTGGGITSEKLDEAAGIISQRVNGVGVAESEVSTQGSNIIVVEVPGKAKEGLADTIGSTAQLRFRLQSLMIPPQGTQTPTTPEQTTPTDGTATGEQPSDTPESGTPSTTEAPSGGTTANPGDSTDKNRAGAAWLEKDPKAAAPSSTAPANEDPTGDAASGDPTGTEETGGVPPALVPPQLEDIKDPLAWVQSPPEIWKQRLAAFDCDTRNTQLPGEADLPDQPLLACDSLGNRYLLGPMMVDGTDVTDASYGIPQNALGGDYAVNVEFNGQGSKDFADVTRSIASMPDPNAPGDQMRLAIVLDGEMLSNPSNEQAITGGRAEITGNFSESEAKDLSNSLKYGALPLTFTVEAESDEGPELAANQLQAGIIAGVIGLLLVVIYCMLYYRGLSIVVIASLMVAGLMTYASVLLLGHGYGFTLTLPGIAGLIVAVGITADSFIVYFERLRDEVREGRTLRTSVETGWARARATILAADAVSFLAALILFIFAIGVVKGFAFALGLITVIDVFIVFFFTKPMVTLLSRTKFFGHGHKWSGLDREHLGLPPLPDVKPTAKPQTVGGEA
jgi:preprotein translocase subunit SecD